MEKFGDSRFKRIVNCMLTLFLACVFLVGCGQSNKDKESEEQPLPPVITFPVEGQVAIGESLVHVDFNGGDRYSSVALLVNGVEVSVDDTAPYELEWNSYFFSDTTDTPNSVTLLVEARSVEGATLRSELKTVEVEQLNAGNQIFNVVSPKPFRSYPLGTNSIEVAWQPILGASSYSLRARMDRYTSTTFGEAIESESPSAILEIPGNGYFRHFHFDLRASSGNQTGPWWYLTRIIVESHELIDRLTPPQLETHIDWKANTATVSVDVDNEASYQSVSLFVNDVLVHTDLEAPYTFTFNPYFSSTSAKEFFGNRPIVRWHAEAVLDNGQSLKSASESLNFFGLDLSELFDISFSTENASLQIDPTSFRAVDQITIHLPKINGAASYCFSLEQGSRFSTCTSAEHIVVPTELATRYLLSISAVDHSGLKGPPSLAVFKVHQPMPPDIITPSAGASLLGVSTVEVVWEPVERADHYLYRWLGSQSWINTAETRVVLSGAAPGVYGLEVIAIVAGHDSQVRRAWFSIEPADLPPLSGLPDIDTPPSIGQPKQVRSLSADYDHGVGSIEVEWEPGYADDFADSYLYRWKGSGDWLNTTETRATLVPTDFEPGGFGIEVVAVSVDGQKSTLNSHWFSFELPPELEIRLGKMQEPLGLRIVWEDKLRRTTFLVDFPGDFLIRPESYRVIHYEIATDPEFVNIIKAERIVTNSPIEVELAAGTYYVRAKNENEFGLEGDWSEVIVGNLVPAVQ